MRGVVRLSLIAAVIPVLALGGCSSDKEGGSRVVGPPTTTDEADGELGEFPGVLGGEADCLWLETENQRRALVFPQGTTVRDADGAVVLVLDGDDVAKVDDEVVVTGGFRDDAESCIEGDSGAIVVNDVQLAE